MICTRCGSRKHTAARCPLNRRRMLVLAVAGALLLGGCAATPVETSAIRPPSARLMVPPRPLPEIRDGDDLVARYIELAEEAADDKARLRSLQGYVRTMRGK